MTGLVITGGEGPRPEALIKIARDANIIVAADSGLIAAEEAGLAPDWIVGDMDSLASNASSGSDTSIGNDASRCDIHRLDKYPPERVIRYPVEKDLTDTEIALALLREKGCEEIWLAGGGGGRIDHLFAIFSLFEHGDPPDRWFTANEEIRCLREGSVLSATLPPGSPVSVFPVGAGPWQAESTGLKWPLENLLWNNAGLGLSNVAENGSFEIRSKQGRFLVVIGNF